MRSIFAGVVGLFGLLVLVPAALGQPRTPREALEENHPGVRFYDEGERTRVVYGVPMTAAETPELAAELWLGLYGEIFIDGREEGGPDLRQFTGIRTFSGNAILAYTQFMDGVPVESSSARILVAQDGGQWRVAYVSTIVALRPIGGLPDPTVPMHAALRAAQEHEAGLTLTRWRTPQHVAIYNDGPTGTSEAQPVWKCVGSGVNDTRTFYVDALSGGVLEHFSNVSHGHDADISGTITGKKSPGIAPDRSDTGCENLPAAEAMPFIHVQAKNGSTVITSTFTDENGGYTLDYDGGTNVTVLATLKEEGEAWKVVSYGGDEFLPCIDPIESGDPVEASTTANSPSTGIDLELNSSPSEFATAQVNVAHAIATTRAYIRDRVPAQSLPQPGLDDVIEAFVNVDVGSCNGRYNGICFGCNEDEPCLILERAESTCTNSGFSTIVAHEYGHYIQEEMLSIMNSTDNKAFHEGFCDALALLTYDTDVIARLLNLDNCDDSNNWRCPLCEDPQYPRCHCCTLQSPYDRSLILSALWLDLRDDDALGLSTARQLHVDWMFLAQVPTICPSTCGTCDPPYPRKQAAAEVTLLQVLAADDNDGNLNNGTPNITTICDVFEARGITTTVCQTSLVGRCTADCDGSTGLRVLDVWDYLCFQNRFGDGDPRACNCDTSTGMRVCDVFDFLCFQKAFAEGCP